MICLLDYNRVFSVVNVFIVPTVRLELSDRVLTRLVYFQKSVVQILRDFLNSVVYIVVCTFNDVLPVFQNCLDQTSCGRVDDAVRRSKPLGST